MVRTWGKSLLVVLGLSLAGPAAVLGQQGPEPPGGPPQQTGPRPPRQRTAEAQQRYDKMKADQAAKNLKAKGFKSETDMWRQERLKQKQKPPPPPKGKPPSQQKYKPI